jgi:hypothetical protein
MNAIHDKSRESHGRVLRSDIVNFSLITFSCCSRDEAKRNRGPRSSATIAHHEFRVDRLCERNEVERGNPGTCVEEDTRYGVVASWVATSRFALLAKTVRLRTLRACSIDRT